MIDGNNFYALQPRKRGQPKISFHASGQRHVKIDKGEAQIVDYRLPPDLIEGEEGLFTISFENFASLRDYRAQRYDATEVIDITQFKPGTLPFVQVSIGQTFRIQPDVHEPDYIEKTLHETIMRDIPPKICVRVKVLENPSS